MEAVRRRAQRRRFVLRSLVVAGALLVLVLALVTKASERRLAAELDHTRTQADRAHQSSVRRTRQLLKRVAMLDADRDPAKALAAALQSRELGPDSDLDPIAWQARLAGVPEVLPRDTDGGALVGWSPDASKVATASPAAGLRLLDVGGPGRRVLHWPAGFGKSPTVLAFAPDSSRIALGDRAGSIVVMKASGGLSKRFQCSGPVRRLVWKEDDSLLAGCGTVPALELSAFGGADGRHVLASRLRAFSLDKGGARVALVGADGGLAVLDTDDASRTSLEAGDADVTAVALLPDGSTLLAGSARGRVARVVLAAHGLPEWHDTTSSATWQLLEASPDGERWLGIDADQHAVLWNARLEPVSRFFVKSALHTWIPSRRTLAIAIRHDAIRLLSEDTGTVVGRLAGATKPLGHLAADRDGHWLVASSRDGGVRAWPLDEASVRVVRGPAPAGTRCNAASDGSAVACLDAHALAAEPTGGDRRAGSTSVDLPPGARPPAGGKLPFAIGPRAATAAWELPGGNLARVHGGTASVVHGVPAADLRLAYGRSGSPLALAGDRDGRHVLLLARTQTEPPGQVSALPAPVTALGFSHDDAHLAVGDGAGAVRLVDVPDASMGAPIVVARGQAIKAVALSQDGATLAVATPSGQVRIRPLSRKTSRSVYTAASAVRCLVWTVGGRGLVVGTAGGRVWLVDTAGSRVLTLLAAPSAIDACVRTPGDDRYTFVTADGMVWQRQLDLDPIWMIDKPADALDPDAAALEQWKGLGRSARTP